MAPDDTRFGVVVGVDGSAEANVALRWAAREAAMRKVPLTVAHVLNAPAAGSWALTGPMAPLPGDFLEQLADEGRAILADAVTIAKQASAAAGGHAHIASELMASPPVPALVDASKEADMMVVGARGQSALRRVLLGSVSTGLIHHAHCPVAVIRGYVSEQSDTMRAPVLVGIDGSPASELATAIAFEEASLRSTHLVALHAWSDADMAGIRSLEWSAMQSAAEEILAERLAGWQDLYSDVSVHRVIEFDQPARHLLRYSESAQLVVVGSHGRGGFAGMLLGSVSTAVAHAAHTPLIVARRP